jgi:hypothetical protein
MMPFDENATITNERQLKDVASHCVKAFWSEVARQPQPSYTIAQAGCSDFPAPGYCGARLLSVQNTARNMAFKFCTKNILGQPKVVLEAALELELALLMLKQMRERFRFNYQRRIAPLIPVTGAAVHIIRNMVWEIEKALQRHAATRFLIDRQRARPQLLFYYHQLQPSSKEKSDYRKRQPHDWVHSLYLCQKSTLFLPLRLMQNSGLSPALDSYWWNCHNFFSSRDRNVLEQLAAVPTHQHIGATTPPRENRYADQVVAMFRLLPV